ncbi:hypothetical protein BX666DRAFT_873354 [Dichotomocladium elegans]|nr:hypothetical protein BX666DRAFT_873354 [Dichotomocladium elegans]
MKNLPSQRKTVSSQWDIRKKSCSTANKALNALITSFCSSFYLFFFYGRKEARVSGADESASFLADLPSRKGYYRSTSYGTYFIVLTAFIMMYHHRKYVKQKRKTDPDLFRFAKKAFTRVKQKGCFKT